MKEYFKELYLGDEKTNYDIGTLGTVIQRKTGNIVNPTINKQNNRKQVSIYHNGKQYKTTLSRLMALAHLGLPDGPLDEYEADHIDGDRTNDVISNIQWLTKEENKRKEIEIDNKVFRGEDNGNCKTTEELVNNILADTVKGFTPSQLSKKYGIPESRITDIRTRTWAHLRKNFDFSNVKISKHVNVQKYNKEFKEQIKQILIDNPGIKNKDVCKKLHIDYNNKIRCLINKIRDKNKYECIGSTTNENGYLDGYYNIIINIPE